MNLFKYLISLLFGLLLVLLIQSCTQKKSESIPQNILKKETMVNVLCDVHLTDAILQLKSNQPKEFIHLSSSKMFDSVLKENKITTAQFDSSLKFYAANPELMKEIYEQVVEKISLKN
jgi:hypothetical protein